MPICDFVNKTIGNSISSPGGGCEGDGHLAEEISRTRAS
jgi:hypothetical protein